MQVELPSTLVIGLDDPAALQPGVVGAKAARLAAARQAGLRVLPGVVLDVGASLDVLGRAVELARTSGTASARIALGEAPVPSALAPAVRAALGTGRLVARSSSPLEADSGWSGAFTSYIDISVDELETAVRGCWSSMFSRDASARFEDAGSDPAAAGMAVLVQPLVEPEPGGVADVLGTTVEVTVADGSLSGMLLGWNSGVRGTVEEGRAPHGPAVDRFGPEIVVAVADVVRHCAAAIGDNHLEWARVDGEIVILQCRRVERARTAAPSRRSTSAFAGPLGTKAARLVSRYGGSSGDLLVLPWAFAPSGTGTRHRRIVGGAADQRFHGLVAAADRLAASAWEMDAATAPGEARRVLGALRDLTEGEPFERLSRLHRIDASDGAALIAVVEALGAKLAGAGRLDDPSDVWRMSPVALAEAFEGAATAQESRPGPVAPDPWEPLVIEAVWANGTASDAEPASDGEGGGRILRLDAPRRLAGSLQRYVLYVDTPQPGYAPLLWGAAGLIAGGGSAGAHLFDVARSLGVPAVAGCPYPTWAGAGGLLAAVDGGSGAVAWLESEDQRPS